MRIIILYIFICGNFFLSDAHSMTLTSPLVNTDWLKKNLDNVIVLDVVADHKYFIRAGHIPNAVPVLWNRIRTTRTINGQRVEKQLPEQHEFELLMREFGINNDSLIIITSPGDGSRSMAAGARLYWQLKYYGHNNVALLDGGNAAWQSNVGTKLVYGPPATMIQGNFTVRSIDKSILATTKEVESVIRDKTTQLLDTRTIPYYLGLTSKSYVYMKGHLPTAKFFPHTILTKDIPPSIFYDNSDILKSAEALSIDLQSPTIVYCNSGNLASGTWFVMHELMGNTNVKLYDGSLHEWTIDSSRPIVSYIIE